MLTGSSQIDEVKETVFNSEEGGENCSTTKASFCESSPENNLHALSQSSTNGKLHSRESNSHALSKSSTGGKIHSGSKKVAFVSIKNPTLMPQSVLSGISVLISNAKAKAFHFKGNEIDQTKDDKGDSLASILTNVNAKDSLF
jgi:hypothetical protein